MQKRISEDCSIDFEIIRVVTSELKLATLGELKTVRSVKDLRDYIEILDVHYALEKERADDEERKRKANSTRG